MTTKFSFSVFLQYFFAFITSILFLGFILLGLLNLLQGYGLLLEDIIVIEWSKPIDWFSGFFNAVAATATLFIAFLTYRSSKQIELQSESALQAVEAQKAAVNAQIEQTKAEQKRDDLRNWKQAEAHRARLTVLLEALSDHCEESFLAYQNVWRQKAPEGDHNQLAFAPETSPYDNFKSLRTPQDEIKEITSGMPFYDEPIVERLAEIFADFQVQYARMQGFQQYKNNQKPAGLIFIPHKHAEERAYEIFTTGMKVSSLYDWARKNENTETFAKNYSTPFSKEYIDRKLEFCTYNESFVRNIRKRFTEPYLRQNKAENEDV